MPKSETQYIDRIFNAKLEAVAERFRTLNAILDEREKAMRLFSENINIRIEHLNALRQEYTEKFGDLVTKDTYTAGHESVRGRLDFLDRWKSGVEGARSRANLISLAAVIIAIISAILHLR